MTSYAYIYIPEKIAYQIIKSGGQMSPRQPRDKSARTLAQLNKILMALMAVGFVGGTRSRLLRQRHDKPRCETHVVEQVN